MLRNAASAWRRLVEVKDPNKTATAGPSYTKGGNVWYVMGISKKAWRSFHLPTSHQPIPSSTTIPGPNTTSHTARPHNISVFPHHPPGYPEHIPSLNIFLPHPLSPQNVPSEAPTTPAQALKTALPAAPPARLQSCPCLHAPISTPAQHPPSRPHPIPNLPGSPQLEQTPPPHQGRNLPFCHQASHWPATPPSIFWNNLSPTSLRTSPAPTPPAFAHQRRAWRPPPGPPHAASRPCTLSQAPPHFLSSHRHIIKQPAPPERYLSFALKRTTLNL